MTGRALLVVGLAVLCEAGVFGWRYSDLLYLNRPLAQLSSDPGFPASFATALQRDRVTRRLLERAAVVANRRGDRRLHLTVLERIVRDHPRDESAHLRLAHALREAGRFDEAERHYRHVLAAREHHEGDRQ